MSEGERERMTVWLTIGAIGFVVWIAAVVALFADLGGWQLFF